MAQYAEPEALGAKALGRLGVEQADLAAALDVTAEPADAVSDLPFDERAEAVLDAALREALRLQHNYIGTEHLLLGSLATGDRTAEVLAGRGVTTATVEPIVLAELEPHPRQPPALSHRAPAPIRVSETARARRPALGALRHS